MSKITTNKFVRVVLKADERYFFRVNRRVELSAQFVSRSEPTHAFYCRLIRRVETVTVGCGLNNFAWLVRNPSARNTKCSRRDGAYLELFSDHL